MNDDSKTYLAFFENTESENPDFHHLDSFGDVPDAVTADGYVFPDAFSNLWSTAIRPVDQHYHFLYEVVYPADCVHFTMSEEYSCAVSTTRNEVLVVKSLSKTYSSYSNQAASRRDKTRIITKNLNQLSKSG